MDEEPIVTVTCHPMKSPFRPETLAALRELAATVPPEGYIGPGLWIPPGWGQPRQKKAPQTDT